jgi:hypothetical protein
MANSLLDFVMSLVRDPDAAARYAENPSQAIADAHLTDVTSVDVNNLIPVVSESLPMGTPATGADAADHGNVWASGAATAAFDAFSDHVPPEATVTDAHGLTSTDVIDQPLDHPLDVGADYHTDTGAELHTVDAGGLDQPLAVDEVHGVDDPAGFGDPGAFDHAVVDHPVVEDHGFTADAPSFDIFE